MQPDRTSRGGAPSLRVIPVYFCQRFRPKSAMCPRSRGVAHTEARWALRRRYPVGRRYCAPLCSESTTGSWVGTLHVWTSSTWAQWPVIVSACGSPTRARSARHKTSPPRLESPPWSSRTCWAGTGSVAAITTAGEPVYASTDTAYVQRPTHKRRTVDQLSLVL